MADVGSINAEFDLNADKFYAGMSKVESTTKKISNTVEKTSKRMERAMTGSFKAMRVAATYFAVSGIGALTTGVASLFSEMEAIDRKLIFATGSVESATEAYSMLRDEAERLGLSIEVLAGQYGSVAAAAKGTVLEGEGLTNIFLAISEASAVLGLSMDDTKGAFYAVQQMMSKGQITAEEMKGQLGERLPGAMQILSRATDMTITELNKLMELGGLMSSEVLPLLAKTMRKELSGSVEEAANSVGASFNRMKNALFDVKKEFTTANAKIIASFFDVITFAIKTTADAVHLIIAPVRGLINLFGAAKRELSGFISSADAPLGIADSFSEEEKIVSEKVKKMQDSYKGLVGVGSIKKTMMASISETETETSNVSTAVAENTIRASRIIEENEVRILKDRENRIKTFNNKFATLEESLTTRISMAGASWIEASQMEISSARDRQIAEVKKFYETQVRFLSDANETKIALTREYEETVALINQAALEENKVLMEGYSETLFEETVSPVLGVLESSLNKTSELLVSMAQGGEASFKELINSILADLQRFITEIFVIQPIIKSFKDMLQSGGFGSGGGGLAGSLLGSLTSAIGFADGGVLDEPVVGVGLSTGSKYSFAERGPEAIVPLEASSPDAFLSGGSFSGGATNNTRSGDDNVIREGGNKTEVKAINITVNALDSKSVSDLLRSNPQAITKPIIEALQLGDRGLSAAIRGAV